MRMGAWLVLGVVGFGVMAGSFWERPRLDPNAPYGSAMMVIGAKVDAPAKVPEGTIVVAARLAAATARGEAILGALALSRPELAAAIEPRLRPKILLWPMEPRIPEVGREYPLWTSSKGFLFEPGRRIDATWLKSGRLPAPGTDEILAGSDAAADAPVMVDDRSLTVVGVLRPDLVLLADAYLVPENDRSRALFPPGDPRTRRATLIPIPPPRIHEKALTAELKAAFPAQGSTRVVANPRIPDATYRLYLMGLALFLLGGTGVLRELYRAAAKRVGQPMLAAPLAEIDRRPRLFWTVHLVYFGLLILSSIVIRGLPEFRAVMDGALESEFAKPGGVMATAGAAYGSRSVPRAALTTFVINFFLGSLAFLTLPSLILPGSGAIPGALRAAVWGVLLAPTNAALAQGMIPHSGTLLLEGEAYILAVFFGLLVPIQIFQKGPGGSAAARYLGAVLLNLKAQTLVALVLGVAAWYEAFEVIAQIR